MHVAYIGPPYDSVENGDYAQNQRDNGRYSYRNPGGYSNSNSGGYDDNFRLPPKDNNNPQSVRPQVKPANEVIARVQFY